MKTSSVALWLVAATLVGGVARAQQRELDRELEEAKALYREAKFAQAIAKLQETITLLRPLRDVEVRRAQLVDAYLHLALSYLALNDPAAAKESLKAVVRFDRDRRLDPQVYAPKVIELFEQAKAEVATEPPVLEPEKAKPAAPAAKKGGSKAVPILVGAGGAAAIGIAVAAGGNGGATPMASGSNDVALLSADPPAGSTISLASRSRVTLSLVVNCAVQERCHMFLKIDDKGMQDFCEVSLFTEPIGPGSSIRHA